MNVLEMNGAYRQFTYRKTTSSLWAQSLLKRKTLFKKWCCYKCVNL